MGEGVVVDFSLSGWVGGWVVGVAFLYKDVCSVGGCGVMGADAWGRCHKHTPAYVVQRREGHVCVSMRRALCLSLCLPACLPVYVPACKEYSHVRA